MASLPVYPSFAYQQVASITQLQQLAYAVQTVAQPPGQALLTQTVTQSFTTATATAVQFTALAGSAADTMWTSAAPTQLVCVTPGYYDLDAGIWWNVNGTGARSISLRITTGSDNPAGPGVQTVFGQVAGPAFSGSSVPTFSSTGILSPYMYAADYVEVLGYQSSGGALTTDTAAYGAQLCACLESLGP